MGRAEEALGQAKQSASHEDKNFSSDRDWSHNMLRFENTQREREREGERERESARTPKVAKLLWVNGWDMGARETVLTTEADGTGEGGQKEQGREPNGRTARQGRQREG